mgnify:CR=1 FL=1
MPEKPQRKQRRGCAALPSEERHGESGTHDGEREERQATANRCGARRWGR